MKINLKKEIKETIKGFMYQAVYVHLLNGNTKIDRKKIETLSRDATLKIISEIKE